MKGLRVLRVLVFGPGHTLSLGERMIILAPLRTVKNLDMFDVHWPWGSLEGVDPHKLEGAPFRLVKLYEPCRNLRESGLHSHLL